MSYFFFLAPFHYFHIQRQEASLTELQNLKVDLFIFLREEITMQTWNHPAVLSGGVEGLGH